MTKEIPCYFIDSHYKGEDGEVRELILKINGQYTSFTDKTPIELDRLKSYIVNKGSTLNVEKAKAKPVVIDVEINKRKKAEEQARQKELERQKEAEARRIVEQETERLRKEVNVLRKTKTNRG